MFSCCIKSPAEQKGDKKNGKNHQASPVKEQPHKATNSKSPSPQKQTPRQQSQSPQSKSPAKVSDPKKSQGKSQSPSSAISPDQVKVTVAGSSISSHIAELNSLLDTQAPPAIIQEKSQKLKELLTSNKETLSGKMASDLSALIARLEAVTVRLEATTPGGGGGGAAQAPSVPDVASPFVHAYDDFRKGSFAQFLTASNTIGGDVKALGNLVNQLVSAQREFLVKASKSKCPPQDKLMEALKPMADRIADVTALRDSKRGSEFFNHLSTLSEAVAAFGWVSVSPTPVPFAKDMGDAGQFYSNRVLKDFKEKDKTHVDWVRSWNGTMGELQAYIKQHHTTGVSWNPKGGDFGSASAPAAGSAPPPPPPVGGAPPPPPPPGPPPPPEVLQAGAPAGSGDDDSRSALFDSLNRGADITKSLKKVTSDMQTHKNANLKLQTPRPYKASPPTAPKPFKSFGSSPAKKEAPKKPPKTELDGKKWIVEYHEGNRNISITDTNPKQSVYIFRSNNSTVQVKGKVNSIVVDSCKKTGVVFEDVIAAIEFVNCQSVQGQVTGTVPTVSIDKTDGCMMYLSAESTKAEIVSAKSSEMNILIPDSSGEFKEYAVSEQFKTTFNGTTLVTQPTDVSC